MVSTDTTSRPSDYDGDPESNDRRTLAVFKEVLVELDSFGMDIGNAQIVTGMFVFGSGRSHGRDVEAGLFIRTAKVGRTTADRIQDRSSHFESMKHYERDSDRKMRIPPHFDFAREADEAATGLMLSPLFSAVAKGALDTAMENGFRCYFLQIQPRKLPYGCSVAAAKFVAGRPMDLSAIKFLPRQGFTIPWPAR